MSTVGDDMEKKSLASEYPDIATEWHPTKNGDLLPEDVAPKSGKKVWWVGKCGHEWQAKVYARTNGHGCPYCSNNKVLSGYNDLATARPDLAEEWHPSKNGNLMADMVAPLSSKKVWWLGKCGHEWQAVVEGRYYGNGCPICANQVTAAQAPDFDSVFRCMAMPISIVSRFYTLPRTIERSRRLFSEKSPLPHFVAAPFQKRALVWQVRVFIGSVPRCRF